MLYEHGSYSLIILMFPESSHWHRRRLNLMDVVCMDHFCCRKYLSLKRLLSSVIVYYNRHLNSLNQWFAVHLAVTLLNYSSTASLSQTITKNSF